MMASKGEDYRRASMLAQEAADRLATQEVGREGRQAERLASQEKKSFRQTMLNNRLAQAEKDVQAANNAYDRMAIKYGEQEIFFRSQPELKKTWDANMEGARRRLNDATLRYEETKNFVQGQFEAIGRELGEPMPEMPKKPGTDPVEEFDTYMRKTLPSSFYALLTTSTPTVDARYILARAQAKGVSPEEYLNALLEARNVPQQPTQEQMFKRHETVKPLTTIEIPKGVKKTLGALFPLRGQY
jgi:hypothetical protein